MNQRFFRMLLTAALAAPGVAMAEDWPQWRGPMRDGISHETGLVEQWPKAGASEVWSKPVGEGYASPIALKNRLYLFTVAEGKETLTALTADKGDVLWSQSYPLTRDKLPGGFEGVRATPTIDGDCIYTFGQGADLVARRLSDGKELWRVNALQLVGQNEITEWGASSSPLIVGDWVYVQTGGAAGPVAVAIDKKTGKLGWKSQAQGKSGYAACTLVEIPKMPPQLVVFGGEALYGMDPKTGRTIWEESWPTQYDVNAAMPVYRDGKLFVTAAYNTGRCAMFDLTGGKPKKLWEKKDITCRFQPPILDGTALYANSEGTLKCMNWADGKILWSAKLNLGAGGSLLRWGDRLITLSEKGQLTFLQATPAGSKTLGKQDLFDADRIWSTPLLYKGKLYAKGKDNLVCLDLGAK